jgi:hypothetical protein
MFGANDAGKSTALRAVRGLSFAIRDFGAASIAKFFQQF